MALLFDLRSISGRILKTKDGINSMKWASRQFSKVQKSVEGTVNIPSKEIVTPLPPLTQTISGLPEAVYADPRSEESSRTQVTTLSNGLKVASERRFGQFCTVGVVINSGSRFEVSYPNGVSHFLEKLAFGSTQEYTDKENLLSVLERHGGICDCQSSRDTFVYATSADRRGLPSITKVLGEVVLRPMLTPEEVELARQTVGFELQTLAMRPEQEPLLMDMIHSAAFRDNTLGLPKICPKTNVETIDKKSLVSYLSKHFTPSRMVVAGVGVEHDALVEEVQKFFVDSPAAWDGLPDDGSPMPDQSSAVYTGGIVQEDCEIPLYPGSDLPELSHVVIALEGCSHQDDDFITMCVLNMMMGGGGSFSAGGPGKGMYTRLYTNVLNRYHWMYNATAYNHAYSDTGLFCIHAASPPARIGDTVDVLLREMVAMGGDCNAQELRRAKTQLQSMLLMNLEARPVVFEDIGRQVLATGSRKTPKFFIDAIDEVTEEDVKRVARRLLSSAPSVAARGKLASLPSLEHIQNGIQQTPRSPSRLSLFR